MRSHINKHTHVNTVKMKNIDSARNNRNYFKHIQGKIRVTKEITISQISRTIIQMLL